jgi:hypothetical protein
MTEGSRFMASLLIYNPSDYSRKGHVSVRWQPIEAAIGIPPQELVLRDDSNALVPFQVDRIDPNDPSRDILTFSLVHAVRPGPDNYSTPSGSIRIERGIAPHRSQDSRAVVQKGPDGYDHVAGLVNNRLRVWFNLQPAATDSNQNWYAGSATSVQLDNLEMLDAIKSRFCGWEGHDPEKRAMQITELQLLTDRRKDGCGQVTLIDKPYDLIAHSSGPVRASITLASAPFTCECCLSSSHVGTWRWRLHRVLSLYSGADYLTEELYLAQVSQVGQPELDDHSFKARYFSYMEMGYDAHIYRFPYVDDWFAVGCRYAPCPGYGFATDIHTTNPQRDPAGLPNPNKCFTWQTLPATSARCMHLFTLSRFGLTCGQPGHFDCRAGHAWYELVFKEIIARLKI